MAVSFRVTGAWAELTADGTVAIPATPQAGDRMYLFVRVKGFSTSATVANWTEITQFADGAVASGNGTGSVRVACWYRDWQSGDANPTIDFIFSPSTASVVIMVMQKTVADVWATPSFVTAAMTNWTTTSQIVAASSTADVPDGGVVMGLIGIRDDTATMTRPTTGIDDSSAAITWNGNYVESPATHHSTTTGDDGAADLGYRLVTTGATATLRMTGTISAAETGAALWVVQGVDSAIIPTTATLTISTFAPKLTLAVTVAAVALTTTGFAPSLKLTVIPSTASLATATFAPSLHTVTIPTTATLAITSFPPTMKESITPATGSLTITSFVPTLANPVTPASQTLTISTFAPTLVSVVIPTTLSLSITTFRSSILPFDIIFLDPGGDATQTVGHLSVPVPGSGGVITYDTAQKVVGLGSYKFDSDAGGSGDVPAISVVGVMGASRRVSAYFRFDSVPDAVETVTEFVNSTAIYSGGGFTNDGNLIGGGADDGLYATASPSQNAGQGTVVGSLGFDLVIPVGAVIDLVKIIYERKYDVDTSIGISRVKYRIDGVEGPDHNNTDEPLTDTVVEVDVTADRAWERQYLMDGVFEVIAEARRGNTATSHTQSWDYLKVEVEFHRANVILAVETAGDFRDVSISITPSGSGAVLRLTDGAGNSYDGITQLVVNTWYRISFAYVLHGQDDLDVSVYLNGIQELSIEEASTGGAFGLNPVNLTFGWLVSPGADHLCWFDLIYIDDGDDLTDTIFGPERRPPHCTAKLSASVNENNWNTTTGTGAVNERPLSETNLKRHALANSARQTYTLQTAAVGDVDISSETFLGYMGWAWTRSGEDSFGSALVVNGADVDFSGLIGTDPMLIKRAFTSSSYPSNAAGIGMVSSDEGADTRLYECGAVVAHEGPTEDALLVYQLLAEDSITPITDDLRADPPTSYEFCWRVDESASDVTVSVYSLASDGSEPIEQFAHTINGIGRVRIVPGIEVQIIVTVTGGDASVGLWHRLNVD